jgi:hypothetical protein
MSDAPMTVINQRTETNPMSWDQCVPAIQNYENWSIPISQFGSGMVMNSYGPMSININNPSIFLELTQFAITEHQRQWSLTVLSLENNIRELTREMEELKDEIRQLCKTRTFVVPLSTLSPAPYQITQQIPVTIEGDGEEFTATFTEANISASGETEADAIANFKDSLLSCYQLLEKKTPDQLGPLPTRQWTVIKGVVKRTE